MFRELVRLLPQYDFVYLGDSARVPYGNRSFEAVHRYTLEAVRALFHRGCPLVILACNTASARALRTIQQRDLPVLAPSNRVLGVIRPVAEQVAALGAEHVGIVGTDGTVRSESYIMELEKLRPGIRVSQEACPMWVPLIENGEVDCPPCEYFVSRHLEALFRKDPEIRALVLACTHYPLLEPVIKRFVPKDVQVVAQGPIVAEKLADYLRRHPEMECRLGRGGTRSFYTTDSPEIFERLGSRFLGEPFRAQRISLEEFSRP